MYHFSFIDDVTENIRPGLGGQFPGMAAGPVVDDYDFFGVPLGKHDHRGDGRLLVESMDADHYLTFRPFHSEGSRDADVKKGNWEIFGMRHINDVRTF